MDVAYRDHQPAKGKAVQYNPDPNIVLEPTVKVSAPSPRYVTIVVSDGERYAMTEVPRSVFADDAVMLRTMDDMDNEMRKANDQ